MIDAPPWREVHLPGLGKMRIRDSGPPEADPDAPTVLLLHGWTVSADLNWCRTYGPLARRARVVAWDQRGHGSGGLRRTRVPHVEGSQPGKVDLAPRGRAGYHRSMATILTESEPLGASKDTVSPTVAPSSASPSGDPGETTPTSSRCSSMEPTSIRSGSSSPS